MSKSTHLAEVVPVKLVPHGNADSLSVVRVYDYTCVARTADWAGIEKAVWIPPDSLVDTSRPEFDFLAPKARADGKYRIRAIRLRGMPSFGLLIPAPADAVLGEDWAERLGIEHYDPEAEREKPKGGLFLSGEVAPGPGLYSPKYDVDAGRRYAREVFQHGEPALVLEKIHGSSARYVFHDGELYCGSRTEWKKEYPSYDHVTVEALAPKVGEEKAREVVERLRSQKPRQNMWWQALRATPALEQFLRDNPDHIVYGEVYGAVQDLSYGFTKGEVGFVAFDIMKDGRWLDFGEAYGLALQWGVPWVPVIPSEDGKMVVPFDIDRVAALAEGPSILAAKKGSKHVREGVVVRPVKERNHPLVGRVQVKWVGSGYLERSKEPTLAPEDDGPETACL